MHKSGLALKSYLGVFWSAMCGRAQQHATVHKEQPGKVWHQYEHLSGLLQKVGF